MQNGRKDLSAVAAIVFLGWIAYSNSFHGEFQYDDDRLIRFNFALRDITSWKDIANFELFRPLPIASYALNYRISRKDPFSYHVFSFTLHLLASTLFYVLLRRLNPNVRICFLSAALFMVHPLNTEAVSYIASRPVLFCAIFYLAALLSFDSHLRTSHWTKVALFLLFFCLGLASKEEAALIPVAAILYNVIFFGRDSVKKHRLFHVITIGLVGLAAVTRLYFLSKPPHPVSIYFPTEVLVWLHYLYLAIFPVQLNVDHFVDSISVTDWRFLSLSAAFLALIALAWKFRKNHGWLTFWGIWFFLNLLPSSSFVPLNDFMAEHRTYLALFGFSAVVVYVADLASPNSKLIAAALTCLLTFYVAATHQRNIVWQTSLALWHDSVQKSPQKFRPHQNLAFVLFQKGAYDYAIREYLIANSINAGDPRVHTGLGFSYLEKGITNAAETNFHIALKIDPQYIDAKTGLGILRYRRKQYPEALSYFEQVYSARRESVDLVVMMCDSYLRTNHPELAEKIAAEASGWHPAFMAIQRSIKEKEISEALNRLSQVTRKH
jgi:protein O-mannosyl-transferase